MGHFYVEDAAVLYSGFRRSFLRLFHSPRLDGHFDAFQDFLFRFFDYIKPSIAQGHSQFVESTYNYLLGGMFASERSCFAAEVAQIRFMLLSLVRAEMPTQHFELIVSRLFYLVKNNPRPVVHKKFSELLVSHFPVFVTSNFADRFPAKEKYYDFIELILESLYTWILEVCGHRLGQESAKRKLVGLNGLMGAASPLQTALSQYRVEHPTAAIHKSSIDSLLERIKEYKRQQMKEAVGETHQASTLRHLRERLQQKEGSYTAGSVNSETPK